MKSLHNRNLSKVVEELSNSMINQSDALKILAEHDRTGIPELTLEEECFLLQIAYPGIPVEINPLHNEDWFDDDSVSDEEKLAYINSLTWSQPTNSF